MLFRRLMIAAASILAINLAWAEGAKKTATLKLPVKAQLLVLDGVNAQDLDLDRSKPLKLDDRRHQVVFQLSDMITDGGDRNRFTSKPFIMTFHPKAGNAYAIDAPTLKTIRQAEAINSNPTSKINLIDKNGDDVPFEFAILPTKGMQIGRNFAVDVKKFNRGDAPAAASEFSGIAIDETSGFTNAQQNETIYGAATNSSDEAAISGNMLKYWFKKASPETRAEFLQWAQEQK